MGSPFVIRFVSLQASPEPRPQPSAPAGTAASNSHSALPHKPERFVIGGQQQHMILPLTDRDERVGVRVGGTKVKHKNQPPTLKGQHLLFPRDQFQIGHPLPEPVPLPSQAEHRPVKIGQGLVF